MRAVMRRLRVLICSASGSSARRFLAHPRLDDLRMADGADHLADADHLALREPAVELFEHGFRRRAGGLGSTQADRVAVDHGLDAETVLEHGEIGVIIAQQIAHEPHVVEEHDGRLSTAIGMRGGRALQRSSTPPRQ